MLELGVSKVDSMLAKRWNSLLLTDLLVIVFESCFQLTVSILLHIQFVLNFSRQDSELPPATQKWTDASYYISIIVILMLMIL